MAGKDFNTKLTLRGSTSITRKDLERGQGSRSIFQTRACFSDRHMNDARTFEAHNNHDDWLQSQHSEKSQHQKETAKGKRQAFY